MSNVEGHKLDLFTNNDMNRNLEYAAILAAKNFTFLAAISAVLG